MTGLSSPTQVSSWSGNPCILVAAERGLRAITRYEITCAGEDPEEPSADEDLVVDLHSKAFLPNSIQEQAGVTGFAFDPRFAIGSTHRFIYVTYTRASDFKLVVERYTIKPGMIKATPSTAVLLYESQAVANTIHGAGQLHFDTRPIVSGSGPILYIPRGDNANNFDCCGARLAQMMTTNVGKLLALDVDASPNPTATPTILALGLRNPWGTSVDRGDAAGQGRGDVSMGDVGHQITGSVLQWLPTSPLTNYGWPWREGDSALTDNAAPELRNASCFLDSSCGAPNPLPLIAVPWEVHSDNPTFPDVLIGGCVYRNSEVTALQHRYVYATAQTVGLYWLNPVSGSALERVPFAQATTAAWQSAGQTIHAIGQDEAGEILVVRVQPSLPVTAPNGDIFRITP